MKLYPHESDPKVHVPHETNGLRYPRYCDSFECESLACCRVLQCHHSADVCPCEGRFLCAACADRLAERLAQVVRRIEQGR